MRSVVLQATLVALMALMGGCTREHVYRRPLPEPWVFHAAFENYQAAAPLVRSPRQQQCWDRVRPPRRQPTYPVGVARGSFVARSTRLDWPAGAMQTTRWVPTTHSAENSLVEWAFANGLSDPRGAPYVEAVITTSNTTSSEPWVRIVHGWLVDAGASSRVPMLLAWNGHLYELATVRGPVNIQADIDASLADYIDRCRDYFRSRDLVEALGSFSPAMDSLMSRVFLRRLGLLPAQVEAIAQDTRDIRQRFFLGYAATLYQEIITAHVRDDSAQAVRCSRQFQRFASGLWSIPITSFQSLPRPIGYSLDWVRQIERDALERYAQHSAQATQRRSRTLTLPLQGATPVASLIDDLSKVNFYTGHETARHPTILSLLAIGEPAVNALIDAYETDQRLTRAVRLSDETALFQPVYVAEVVESLLRNILGPEFTVLSATSPSGTRTLATRRTLATALRQQWHEFAPLTREQRWLRHLSDDDAEVGRWLAAAHFIVGSAESAPWFRQQQSPSVTELFLRRSVDLLQRAERYQGMSGAETQQIFHSACEFARVMVRWERSQPSLLRSIAARWRQATSRDVFALGDGCLVDLWRVAGLNTGATSPPVASGPTNTTTIELRGDRWLSVRRGTTSIEYRSSVVDETNDPSAVHLLTRDFSLRLRTLRALQDHVQIGTLVIANRGQYTLYDLRGNAQMTGFLPAHSAYPQGTWPWRACDEAAVLLEPTPPVRMLNDPANRDAVIAEWIRRLER